MSTRSRRIPYEPRKLKNDFPLKFGQFEEFGTAERITFLFGTYCSKDTHLFSCATCDSEPSDLFFSFHGRWLGLYCVHTFYFKTGAPCIIFRWARGLEYFHSCGAFPSRRMHHSLLLREAWKAGVGWICIHLATTSTKLTVAMTPRIEKVGFTNVYDAHSHREKSYVKSRSGLDKKSTINRYHSLSPTKQHFMWIPTLKHALHFQCHSHAKFPIT